MNQCGRILFANSLLGLLVSFAQANEGTWKINDGKLVLRLANGSTRKEMDLSSTENREVSAAISQSGKYAFVKEIESQVISGQRAPLIKGSYYDSAGKMLWEKRKVGQYWISDDGAFVLLTIDEPEDCTSESGCSEAVVSMNTQGGEVLKLGPYGDTVGIWLSPNHRYGYASPPGKTKYFFDVSKKKPSIKLDQLPGQPTIRDDGTVEFVKNTYGNPDRDGAPVVLKSEIVKKLKIH